MISKIKKAYTKVGREIPACKGIPDRTAVLLDFARCKLKYRVTFEEYRQYSFYKLKDKAKKEYVTEHDVLDVIPEKFNNSEQRAILDDKARFNEFYRDLIGREYRLLASGDEEQFLQFIKGKKQIIVKPLDSWCGHGVQKCFVPDEITEQKRLFDTLVKDYSAFLAEECFQQHKAISKLNPDTVNTLRVISIADSKGEIHIPFASVRIGREGAVVDNFCAGGMAASIDTSSGLVVSAAIDGAGKEFLIHPDTGTSIIGYSIPYWKEVLETVRSAAKRLTGIRFIGWDVVIREDGRICLLEGNSNPGARTIQMPLKRGIKPDYQKYLGKF